MNPEHWRFELEGVIKLDDDEVLYVSGQEDGTFVTKYHEDHDLSGFFDTAFKNYEDDPEGPEDMVLTMDDDGERMALVYHADNMVEACATLAGALYKQARRAEYEEEKASEDEGNPAVLTLCVRENGDSEIQLVKDAFDDLDKVRYAATYFAEFAQSRINTGGDA